MRFRVKTSGHNYEKEYSDKLKKLGFTFDSQGFKCIGSVEVEIPTLEDLIAFSNEWGDIIVSDGDIEIYDDYRE